MSTAATVATPATAPAVDHLMTDPPGHRPPPAVIANSVVRVMSIMYVRCVSVRAEEPQPRLMIVPSGRRSSLLRARLEIRRHKSASHSLRWNTFLVNDSPAVTFDQLSDCDLVLERIYKGGAAGNTSDDPLGKLLPGVGNQGGFRPMGRLSRDAVRLVVLYTWRRA